MSLSKNLLYLQRALVPFTDSIKNQGTLGAPGCLSQFELQTSAQVMASRFLGSSLTSG